MSTRTTETLCAGCGREPAGRGSYCDACTIALGVLTKATAPEQDNCPRCGQQPTPRDWVTCVGCAVQLDPAVLGQVRDSLALWLEERRAWLMEAGAVVDDMPADDPRQERGRQLWHERMAACERAERNHAALCFMLAGPRP